MDNQQTSTDDSMSTTMNGSVVWATTKVASYSQLMAFCQWYQWYHGYVCIVVCVFGIAANIMNVIVLTRRDMVRNNNNNNYYYYYE